MVAEISREVSQTLSDVLSSGEPLAPDQAVGVLRELVRRVAELHDDGRLHLQLVPAAISLGPDGVSLAASETSASLEFLRELLNWPVSEWRRLPRELPTDLAAARAALDAAGLSADPRSFDLVALGDVFCRLLTAQPSSAYRQSLRVKGLVPAALQPLLERMLGTDGQAPFAEARSLWEALEGLRLDSACVPDSGLTEAFPPTPATSTSDTALTGINLGRKPDDTSVAPALRENPPSSSDALPFQKLGHFEIQTRIGHGGMGDVYRGYERSLDRTVAIKVLPAEFSRQADFVRRFQAEATAAARLVHPHIIQIYFIGEDAGHHFFAMQYVDGLSLAALLEQQPKLYVNTAVSLIEQILHGLEEAHALGFVHRDIKPGNILIDRAKQRALLADFGLVKQAQGSQTGMTATGVILGTVDYISPEQARGKEVDGRSDLYSVGVLMYRILSGELPFKADSATALIFQHVYEQPRPLIDVAPHVPDALAAVVAKLMRKNPDDRYRSARDVLTDLAAYRSEQPLPIAAAPGGSPPSEPDLDDLIRSDASLTSSIENLSLGSRPTAALDLSVPGKTGWERFVNRWRSLFQQHAPQALLDLQNTQQQIDGSLAIYQTRRDDLEELVAQARAVRDELAQAAHQSRGQPDEATLAHQLAEQDEQLSDLELRLTKVQSTWQQLISQRDLLNARLKAAGARLKSDGRIKFSRFPRRKILRATAAAAVLLLAVLITSQFVRRTPTAAPLPSPEPKPIAAASGPPLAVAPFDTNQAKAHQEAWAQHLGVPVEYTNSLGMKFRLIPPGEFLMGSPDSDPDGEADEKPQRKVRLTTPYYFCTTEVTQALWRNVMAASPWQGREHVLDDVNAPASYLDWNNAAEFCRKLSAKESSPLKYRLPTEAEWEYAARAGSTTFFVGGNTIETVFKYAWIDRPEIRHPNPIAIRQANAFGLFDITGNVWEWCSDWYDASYYAKSQTIDPQGPESGSRRVLRGGGYASAPSSYRFAKRDPAVVDDVSDAGGLRVVLSVESVLAASKPAAPPSAIAPFDAAQANAHQAAWAKHLGVPIEYTNSIGMKFRLIPPGEFEMGSSPSDPEAQSNEYPQHKVRISAPFYLGTTEVTQRTWTDVMGTAPWKGQQHESQDPMSPATYVNWQEAVVFCEKLNASQSTDYRLPTETEWEYACRAGTTTRYFTGSNVSGLKDFAWIRAETERIGIRTPQPTASKKPNPFGLHDMSGNVWELCSDSFTADYSHLVTPGNQNGPEVDSRKAVRGGGYGSRWKASYRSSRRDPVDPNERGDALGFRLVLSVDAVKAMIPSASKPNSPPLTVAPFDADQTDATETSAQLLQSAKEQWSSGHWEEALSLAERSLKLNPELSEAYVYAVKSLTPMIRRDYAKGGFDLPALKRAMEHHLVGMRHLLQFYATGGTDEELDRGGTGDVYRELLFASNHLQLDNNAPSQAKTYMEQVKASHREISIELFETALKRQQRAGAFLNGSIDVSLPMDESARVRRELILKYQDSPAIKELISYLLFPGGSSLLIESVHGEKLMADLEKQGNATVREAVADRRASWKEHREFVERNKSKNRKGDESLEPVPAGAPHVRFREIKLTYADRAGAKRELPYFTGMMAATDDLDVYWHNSGVYLQSQLDSLGEVWSATSGPSRFHSRFSQVCYDGRYVWVAADFQNRNPSLLVVIDPRTKKTFEFTRLEGLPAAEKLPADKLEPRLCVAALGPGKVFLAGNAGYGWLGTAEYDPDAGGKVEVFHTAAETPDKGDPEQWKKTEVDFQPEEIVPLPDAALPGEQHGSRWIVFRANMTVDVIDHPLIVDPLKQSVSVGDVHNFGRRTWDRLNNEILAIYPIDSSDANALYRLALPGPQLEPTLRCPDAEHVMIERDRIHVIGRQWWTADRNTKQFTPAGPVPWALVRGANSLTGRDRKFLYVLSRSAHHGIIALYKTDVTPQTEWTTLAVDFAPR